MNLRSPIFTCYAHEDENYLNKILTHLEPLRMQDQVCAWSDKDLEPGSEWGRSISNSILNAKVFILLISKHFLASDFIRKSELSGLMSKVQMSNRPIIPILLSPCLYDLAIFKYPDAEKGPEKFELGAIQFFNDVNKPLSQLNPGKQDIEFVKLVKKIYKITHPGTT